MARVLGHMTRRCGRRRAYIPRPVKVDFYEPPPNKRAGGLDHAIQSLRDYLLSEGVGVQTNRYRNTRGNQAQIVHFHGLWQPAFLKVSRHCRRAGIPYVVSPHGMLEPWAWRHKNWKKFPYYYLFERAHFKGADAVLATSEQEAANLSHFLRPDRITTIPLALRDAHQPAYAKARQELRWNPNELVFLFLSRIHPKKGLHLLLQALSAISSSLPENWRLVVVGEGENKYLAECQTLAAANQNVLQHTEWKGAIWGDAKWAYLEGADLFCLPSFSENFGLAILEACQVGTRVLTTRQTPWGFLSEWGGAIMVDSDVESLKRGLISFLNSKSWGPDDRNVLARRIHERFDWQIIGQRYVELYQRLTRASTTG